MTTSVPPPFTETLNKINALLLRLDTQLGTTSLSETELSSLTLPSHHSPLATIPLSNTPSPSDDLFNVCDLRVGKILKCEPLPSYTDIYALSVDINEQHPRTIACGLRKHLPPEALLNTSVIVFANLKPKQFGKAFVSQGMLMCANHLRQQFELIQPESSAKPGDKVYIEGTICNANATTPMIPNNKFAKAIELFNTDEQCCVVFNQRRLRTACGFVKARTLKNAHVG